MTMRARRPMGYTALFAKRGQGRGMSSCEPNYLMGERMPVDHIRPDNLDFDNYKEVLASDGVYNERTNRIVCYHSNSGTRVDMTNSCK